MMKNVKECLLVVFIHLNSGWLFKLNRQGSCRKEPCCSFKIVNAARNEIDCVNI